MLLVLAQADSGSLKVFGSLPIVSGLPREGGEACVLLDVPLTEIHSGFDTAAHAGGRVFQALLLGNGNDLSQVRLDHFRSEVPELLAE